MPLVPASLIEPLWVEFAALIGTEQLFRRRLRMVTSPCQNQCRPYDGSS